MIKIRRGWLEAMRDKIIELADAEELTDLALAASKLQLTTVLLSPMETLPQEDKEFLGAFEKFFAFFVSMTPIGNTLDPLADLGLQFAHCDLLFEDLLDALFEMMMKQFQAEYDRARAETIAFMGGHLSDALEAFAEKAEEASSRLKDVRKAFAGSSRGPK